MGRNENVGRKIGRYELREEIGRGGMAVVYRALDTALEREVALKLLHPHLAFHDESRRRFQREAKTVARLRHPSIVEIFDTSPDSDEEIYLVMELVRGTTLRRYLDSRNGEPLPAEAAGLLVLKVCEALAHAHAHDIVHRDIKPENILIGSAGEVKLSDFGIAHIIGLSQMTVTGQILGSPAYMSPEHLSQAELGPRADVFSAGSVLYEAVVGRQPFEGKNPAAVFKRILDGDYVDPLRIRPVVGHHIACVIRRCLKVDPEARYASTEALVDDLKLALSEVDVPPTEEEIELFFADSLAWEERWRQVAASRSLALGTAARRAKRLPEAMDHFNRVLALESGNQKALNAVAGLSKQQRVRRALERGAVIAPLLLAMAGAAWAFFGSSEARTSADLLPTPRHTDEAAVPVPKPVSAQPRRTEMVREVEKPTTAPVKAVQRTQPRVVAKAKPKREVVFTPHPMAVTIEIDGVERFAFGPANRSRLLEVGTHQIGFIPNDQTRFVARTWTVEVPEGTEPFAFRERLSWRPAQLLVESNIDTFVTVPGRGTGQTNKIFEVGVAEGPTEQVSFVVSANGYIPRSKEVKITAGETTRVTTNLVEDRARSQVPLGSRDAKKIE